MAGDAIVTHAVSEVTVSIPPSPQGVRSPRPSSSNSPGTQKRSPRPSSSQQSTGIQVASKVPGKSKPAIQESIESKRRSEKMPGWKKFMFGLCGLCFVWIVITTFAPKPVGLLRKDGWLCPRKTVCAEDWPSIILLAISRSSAYFCYPLMMVLFLSKTNNLRTFLQRTPLAIFVPFYDLHQLHTMAGAIVGTDVCVHGLCHMIRWGIQGNIEFLYSTHTGRSGAIALAITPLITWPMLYPRFKKALSWEWRKGLHYLSIAWGVAAMAHAPQMHIMYVMGIPVFMYLIDYAFGLLFRSYLIHTSTFARLECGVQLTFEHPPGFVTDGTGYIMVCVPWLSKHQWHAFSLFAHPSKPNHSCVCMCKNGDWTNALHSAIQKPTNRPVWVAGPFASPYSTAIKYDNLILVASGIGITPAMSILTTHKESRRINLIWMCREPSLLEFYLRNCEFDDDAWTLIFYTGKRKLMLDFKLPSTVFIFNGRPNMEASIMQIITGIETGVGLPESVMNEAKAQKDTMTNFAKELSDAESSSTMDAYAKFRILLKKSLATFSEEELIEFIGGSGEQQFNLEDTVNTIMPDAFTNAELKQLAARFDEDGDGDVDLGEFQRSCFEIIEEMMNAEDEELDHTGDREPSFRTSKSKRINSIEDLVTLGRRQASLENMAGLKGDAAQLNMPSNKQSAMSRLNSTTKKGKSEEALLEEEIAKVPPEAYRNWQLLYCGGAQPVVDAMTIVSNRFDIPFKVEKFDW